MKWLTRTIGGEIGKEEMKFFFLCLVALRHKLQLSMSSSVLHDSPGLPHRITHQTGTCKSLPISVAQQRNRGSERKKNSTVRVKHYPGSDQRHINIGLMFTQ